MYVDNRVWRTGMADKTGISAAVVTRKSAQAFFDRKFSPPMTILSGVVAI
jgi:hypothetical protein